MFQVPVPETEYEWVQMPLRNVRRGEMVTLDQDNPTASYVVTENKTGPKWTTLLHAGGTIVRAEPGTTISVSRRSNESAQAAGKALTTNRINKRLRERLEKHVTNERQLEVLAKLTEAAQTGYRPSSFTTSDLLTAQARDEVDARFAQMLKHALEKDENADLQDILRRAVELFSAEIVRRARNIGGLSRSTSVVSNAMEDAVTAAYAKFIDDAEYDI